MTTEQVFKISVSVSNMVVSTRKWLINSFIVSSCRNSEVHKMIHDDKLVLKKESIFFEVA